MRESITLSTGRKCLLENPAVPFLGHYHVLTFPADQGQPSHAETDEMMRIATRVARDIASQSFGDDECFSLIYNGGRTRRRPWPHIHILPSRNLSAKRFAFVAFQLKRWLRRLPAPWRRGR
jgi:hypothetical protein